MAYAKSSLFSFYFLLVLSFVLITADSVNFRTKLCCVIIYILIYASPADSIGPEPFIGLIESCAEKFAGGRNKDSSRVHVGDLGAHKSCFREVA
jgi:hypothetical protein